ncbi:hypothetical protein [Burkholderia pseudomultivorans]|uniref:hypothetical protein n=1 Tax=Burkholderia pseudomultivorans TaxID=1207504 RepID=UPI00158EB8CF|nr:hypothetical protein [Burkholderia pseudomultivorans]
MPKKNPKVFPGIAVNLAPVAPAGHRAGSRPPAGGYRFFYFLIRDVNQVEYRKRLRIIVDSRLFRALLKGAWFGA